MNFGFCFLSLEILEWLQCWEYPSCTKTATDQMETVCILVSQPSVKTFIQKMKPGLLLRIGSALEFIQEALLTEHDCGNGLLVKLPRLSPVGCVLIEWTIRLNFLHLPGSSKDLELNILVWRCMRCTYYSHDNVTIQTYSLDCRLPNHTATTETRTISQSVSSGPSANSQGGCTPSYVWLNPNCSWLNRNDLAIYELQLVNPLLPSHGFSHWLTHWCSWWVKSQLFHGSTQHLSPINPTIPTIITACCEAVPPRGKIMEWRSSDFPIPSMKWKVIKFHGPTPPTRWYFFYDQTHHLSPFFYTRWCPPVISWFINPINYRYIYHKP